MSPDHYEFVHGLKMTAIAVVCAIVTATLVISAGEAWRARAASDALSAELIRTAG